MRNEVIQQARDAMSFRRATESRASTPDDVVFSIIVTGDPSARTEISKFEQGFRKLERRKCIPSVMNLPAGLVQLPYVILSQSKEEWVPVGFDLMTWRALTWPLAGLLFWWSAGRGIDALLAAARKRLLQPKMTAIEGVVGSMCFALCATAAICFPLFIGEEHDPDFLLTLFSISFAVWAILGGTVVLAKVLQWRMAKLWPLPV
jgi:hypothetical protein